jgi:hypothetical protein
MPEKVSDLFVITVSCDPSLQKQRNSRLLRFFTTRLVLIPEVQVHLSVFRLRVGKYYEYHAKRLGLNKM